MSKQLSQTLLLSSLLLLSACSFQKEPGKTKAVPAVVVKEIKEVKTGITEEELLLRVRESGLPFPDLLVHANLLGGDELIEKLVKLASEAQLNQIGKDGDTLLMIAVKEGDPEFAMKILTKGASPYVPSRGTNITPLDIIKDKDESWDYVRSYLSSVEERFAQGGYNIATQFFISDYAEKRFPMTKSVNGHKPHIYHLIEAAEELRRPHCGSKKSLRSFLEVIEKIEGPIQVPDTFEFIRAMVIAEDRFAFEFFKNKLARDFTAEERVDLIKSIKKTNLYWVRSLHSLLDVQTQEEMSLLNDLITKVVDESRKSEILEDMYDPYLYMFYFDNFPSAFLGILGKINGAELLVRNMDGTELFPPYKTSQTQRLYDQIFLTGNHHETCSEGYSEYSNYQGTY